jgi:hypothetical protein
LNQLALVMAIVIAHRERRQWENVSDLPEPRVSIAWAIVAKEGRLEQFTN